MATCNTDVSLTHSLCREAACNSLLRCLTTYRSSGVQEMPEIKRWDEGSKEIIAEMLSGGSGNWAA